MHRGQKLRRRSAAGLLVGTCVAAFFSLSLSSSPSSAFDCGYSPCIATGGADAGFSTIVTAQSLPRSGGTVSGSANGATVTLIVPPWALPHGGEIVIGTGDPNTIAVGPGQTVIADFSISVIDPNSGANIPGPFLPPLVLTISDPSIESTDSLVIVTGPGEIVPVPGADVDAGLLDRLLLSDDANYALIRPTPPPPPPTTTTTVTTTTLTTTTPAPLPVITTPDPFVPPTRFHHHLGRGRSSHPSRPSRPSRRSRPLRPSAHHGR